MKLCEPSIWFQNLFRTSTIIKKKNATPKFEVFINEMMLKEYYRFKSNNVGYFKYFMIKYFFIKFNWLEKHYTCIKILLFH